MPFHPNPVSMVMHVEHHRQELLNQAQQERLAKEAISGAAKTRRGWPEARATLATAMRSIAAGWRPRLAEPLEMSRSTPGEALQ